MLRIYILPWDIDRVESSCVLSSDTEITRDTGYADTMRAVSAARYVSFNIIFEFENSVRMNFIFKKVIDDLVKS